MNLDTILTITKTSLREHITTRSAEKIEAVETAIRFALATE
ncbi:hypothetical protein [Candidatus Methylomirabilis limnetica]|jgi:mRNA-degrading endonuclease toxin of MazEF toxin-antitoxin module|nr:hypothetical protein [Candidatus Methylomirabilis limnetica]